MGSIIHRFFNCKLTARGDYDYVKSKI